MAELWLATLRGVEGFERPLALKRILPSLSRRRAFIHMFVREAKVCSGLQHANIVPIYELGEVDGEYFIAMEYVPGWDLLRVLHRASMLRQPLRTELAIYFASEVLRGLAYAHDAIDASGRPLGIVHMDVSPSNVLVGESGVVKLTDFGVARAGFERGGATTLRGKLSYMSPEQVAGLEVDRRSDIFSVGIMLYEMLTLKRLFRGRTSVQTMANVRSADIEPRLARHPEIPAPVQEVLRRALARSPSERFQSATEMEEALSAYLFDARVRVTQHDAARYLSELFGQAVEGSEAPREPTATASLPWAAGVDESGSVLGSARMSHTDEQQPPTVRRTMLQKMRHSRFTFRADDGTVGEPKPYQKVLRMIVTRAVAPTARVSVDGSDWRSLQEVARLSETLQQMYGQEGGEAADAGFFDRYRIGEIVSRIAAAQETGVLRISTGDARRDLTFNRGAVVAISAVRKEEMLGPFLVRRGVINKVQLRVAFSNARTLDGRLGDALVKLGFLDASRLLGLVQELMRERFSNLFAGESGHCAFFYSDAPMPETSVKLDVLGAFVDGVRRHLDAEAVRGYFERLGNPRVHLAAEPPFPLDRLVLRSDELRVVDALDGPATHALDLFDALIDDEDLDAGRPVFTALFVLHQTGHLASVAPLPRGF